MFLQAILGLPSSELFTKLDRLKENDIFYIHVLNEILTYKVYETKVILPDEINELRVVNGEDFITLVTCTPYGVNTHRLLVKARRTEYEPYIENHEDDSNQIYNSGVKHNYYLIGVILGGLILIVLFIVFIIRKRRKQN